MLEKAEGRRGGKGGDKHCDSSLIHWHPLRAQQSSQTLLVSWLLLFLEKKQSALNPASPQSPPSQRNDNEMNKTHLLASVADVFV